MVKMTKSMGKNMSQAIPDRNTLKVYWFLLMQPGGKAGVRQIQRAMGFSSPNAALFHLNKLQEIHLVQQRSDGEYEVQHKTRFGEMKNFIQIQRFFIPKHAIYAIFMTCIMCAFLVILIPILSLPVLLALLPGILATLILWYEAYIVWQQLPQFHFQTN